MTRVYFWSTCEVIPRADLVLRAVSGGALIRTAECVSRPCRPAQALIRRQWRASEPGWLHGKRWRPTWSLSWRLPVPKLPHTSTGDSPTCCRLLGLALY